MIDRLPFILEKKWQQDAREILNIKSGQTERQENLFRHSACPFCHKRLKPWHNIPLISYLFLKGQCAYCQKPISLQYPTVELLSAIVPTLICLHLGLTPFSLVLCFLFFFLLILSVIDLKHLMIPDCLSISLLWIGLLINTVNVFSTANNAILGAVTGYLVL